MGLLNMFGSYDFTIVEIDKWVTKKQAGNYALGYVNKKLTFIVQYIGRSDSDLNAELKNRRSWTKYKKFKYRYASSAKAAFEKECNNYHDFGGKESLDNEIHPARPDGTDYDCPNSACEELS